MGSVVELEQVLEHSQDLASVYVWVVQLEVELVQVMDEL